MSDERVAINFVKIQICSRFPPSQCFFFFFVCMFLDKPENMQLKTSAAGNKACQGDVISFNCSADANPSVTSYQLFENDTAILNTNPSGMWSRKLTSGGVFHYKCMANNTFGSVYSTSIAVTLNGKQINENDYIFLNSDLVQ